MKQILRKTFFILSCIVFCAAATNAQTAAEVEATIKKMQDPSTPSNAAPEAFCKFLEKFSTDTDFFNSRLAIPESEKVAFAAEVIPANMKGMLPFSKNGEQYYQAFGELQYNKAYLECGYVDSYSTHIYEFVRKNGKWYLTHIVPGD